MTNCEVQQLIDNIFEGFFLLKTIELLHNNIVDQFVATVPV